MLASARGRAWRRTAASASPPVPGRNVGRAFTPAAKALRHRRTSGTMQASSPTKHGARALPGFAGYFRRKAAMHPSVCALRRIHLPLQGRLCKRLPPKRLPCKGLRSRAPPAADTARRSRCSGRRMQACFSMRRMMRIPQTGNGVSRLRGAAPCPANTLPGRPLPPRRARTPALQYNVHGQWSKERQPAPCVGADVGAVVRRPRRGRPLRRGRCFHRPAGGPGGWLTLICHRPLAAAL